MIIEMEIEEVEVNKEEVGEEEVVGEVGEEEGVEVNKEEVPSIIRSNMIRNTDFNRFNFRYLI